MRYGAINLHVIWHTMGIIPYPPQNKPLPFRATYIPQTGEGAYFKYWHNTLNISPNLAVSLTY